MSIQHALDDLFAELDSPEDAVRGLAATKVHLLVQQQRLLKDKTATASSQSFFSLWLPAALLARRLSNPAMAWIVENVVKRLDRGLDPVGLEGSLRYADKELAAAPFLDVVVRKSASWSNENLINIVNTLFEYFPMNPTGQWRAKASKILHGSGIEGLLRRYIVTNNTELQEYGESLASALTEYGLKDLV